MVKKLMLLLCLGAFIAVAAVGGCGEDPTEEESPEETPADTE